MADWKDMELSPHAFTKFMEQLGTQGLEADELFTLDALEDHKPVHGVILACSWIPGPRQDYLAHYDPSLYYSNTLYMQSNAALALLSSSLNVSVAAGIHTRSKAIGFIPLDIALSNVPSRKGSRFSMEASIWLVTTGTDL